VAGLVLGEVQDLALIGDAEHPFEPGSSKYSRSPTY
jgi:hypothetical protein